MGLRAGAVASNLMSSRADGLPARAVRLVLLLQEYGGLGPLSMRLMPKRKRFRKVSPPPPPPSPHDACTHRYTDRQTDRPHCVEGESVAESYICYVLVLLVVFSGVPPPREACPRAPQPGVGELPDAQGPGQRLLPTAPHPLHHRARTATMHAASCGLSSPPHAAPRSSGELTRASVSLSMWWCCAGAADQLRSHLQGQDHQRADRAALPTRRLPGVSSSTSTSTSICPPASP